MLYFRSDYQVMHSMYAIATGDAFLVPYFSVPAKKAYPLQRRGKPNVFALFVVYNQK